MEKESINHIYDRNYAQNYNQRFLLNDLSKIDADFDRKAICDFSIEKSIEFLTSTQLPHGEFKTEIRQQYETDNLWQFDSSPFATALILNSLSFLESDQRVQQIKERGINFLREEQELRSGGESN